ncbi:ECH_0525 family surface protein Esp73 [Ehrlichia muris]|uniref:ECH_0525 family surface protein Esp73 n=1 Tax=Ehrlichia muris TaxID=35795 RepID=UPI0037C0FF40
MKCTLVASTLASFLMLYGNASFSVDILSDINISDINIGKKQVDSINAKDVFTTNSLENKEYNRSLKVGRALVSGQAISYMWSSSDEYRGLSDISGDMDDWGMNYDAILRVGAEIKSNDSGVKYGVDFQVSMPNVKGKNFEKKAALNRGSRIFASTPYGDFSVGYQEGVESIMKLDSSNVIAGDESSSWTQHVRGVLSERKNALGYSMYPFLFSAGLYSENIFRNNDNMVRTVDNGKDFINNLPFRMSYQSPNFMGLRFGVSYSPLGYKFEHFGRVLDLYTTDIINVINKIPEFDVVTPSPGTVDLSTLIEKLKTANLTGTLTLKQDKNKVPKLNVKFKNKSDTTNNEENEYIPCLGTITLLEAGSDGTKQVSEHDPIKFGIEGESVEMEIPASDIELKDLTITLSDLGGISQLSVKQDGQISITPKDADGHKSRVIQSLKNTEDEVFFGAKYEHILSASIAYNYDFNNDLKSSTSVVGEYARPRLYFNTKNHYDIYAESHNLQGISIGSILSYKNVNFALAYGYLGQSGFIKHYIAHKSDTETLYPMYERPSTYYWDMAFGYQYKSSYISVAYFKSNRSDNILQDINLGFEYNLLKEQSKMKCKLFGNYHHYKFSEISIVDSVSYDNGRQYTTPASGESTTNTGKGIIAQSVVKTKKNGSGNIFLVGAKLEF